MMETLDLTSTWAEAQSIAMASADFVKPEPVDDASYMAAQQQYQLYEKLQAQHVVEEAPFTWNSSSSILSAGASYIKSEFISHTNPEVPTLTCKTEYTPTFSTKPPEYPSLFATTETHGQLPFSSDFCLDALKANSSKEAWEDDNSDDDEILEGEDREAVKLRRKLRKMNREKQKRSYLNDKFDELCTVLSLGRNTRVEKLTILTETIRCLEELTKEHYELTQSTHYLRSQIHAHQTGVPCEPQNQFSQAASQPEHTRIAPSMAKLDTDFCMDLDDATLWDNGLEEHTQHKHKLFAETIRDQEKIKVEGSEFLYRKTEDMFAEDDDVDAFFNVDQNFNPSDFSFSFGLVR